MELIISHIICDFDAFASMIAVSLLNPEAKVCIVGAPQNSLQRYLIENEHKFNLIRESKIKVEDITKLFIVDNRNISRMGKIGKWLQTKPTIPIICYDHHPSMETDIQTDNLHVQLTGACITLLLEIIHKKGIIISPFHATLFALGIYEDTGNFLYPNVTEKDFSASAYLFSMGASISIVNHFLKKDFSPEQIGIMSKMIQNTEMHSIMGIEVSIISLKLDTFIGNLAYLLQIVKRSEGLKLAFCLYTLKDKMTIIGRNEYDFIHIEKIMKELGGGGHRSAGSAVIENTNLEIMKKTLLNYLDKQIRDNLLARDIMTSPVDILSVDSSIKQVQMRMLNNRYSTIVIVDNQDKIVGLVTKKDIAKAIHHKMDNISVENCMSSNVISVKPLTSSYAVQEIMIENNIGRLPVIDEGKLAGNITKGDLLKSQLHQNKNNKLDNPVDFTDMNYLLQKNISRKTNSLLKKLGKVANDLQMKIYVVGGFVRDLLIGIPNYDIDVVVEGDGILFAKKFTKIYGKKIVSFPKFQTALVIMPDRSKIDIVTARTEYYRRPGVLPEVETSRLINDIFRRDFTVNSLAISLNSDDYGHLKDFFGGTRDLKNGILKVMHNLSFIEDPTRILRAVRFEQRYGFKLEEKTEHLLKKCLTMNITESVAVERIREELFLSCKERNPSNFYHRLEELGVLKSIYEHLSFDAHKRIIFLRIYENNIWYRKSFHDKQIISWLPYFLSLTHELRIRTKLKFAKKFKMPKIFAGACEKLEKYPISEMGENLGKASNYVIANSLKRYNDETLIFIMSLTDDKIMISIIRDYMTRLRKISLSIDGNFLINNGIKEGKRIGKILNSILEMKINGEIFNINEEETIALKMISSI